MRRLIILCSALALVLFGGLVQAQSASALETWFQSVGRASATAPCPDDSFGTPWQSNWDPAERPWRPSWGQWMNGGTGGFTCDRNITWAQTPYPSAGCVQQSAGIFLDFRGGWSIGIGDLYADAACSIVQSTNESLNRVYAPAPWDGPTLCREAFRSLVNTPGRFTGTDVWTCSGVG